MIKDDNGKVWIRHWNSNPSQHTSPQYGVSLGVVNEEELPVLLATKVSICCGQTKNKYRLATQADISVFQTGRL